MQIQGQSELGWIVSRNEPSNQISLRKFLSKIRTDKHSADNESKSVPIHSTTLLRDSDFNFSNDAAPYKRRDQNESDKSKPLQHGAIATKWLCIPVVQIIPKFSRHGTSAQNGRGISTPPQLLGNRQRTGLTDNADHRKLFIAHQQLGSTIDLTGVQNQFLVAILHSR